MIKYNSGSYGFSILFRIHGELYESIVLILRYVLGFCSKRLLSVHLDHYREQVPPSTSPSSHV